MTQKLYCIYDEEAREVLPAFYAANDDVAKRMAKNSVKSHQFKNFDLDKLRLFYLGLIVINSEDNLIFEPLSCEICKLSSLVDQDIQKAWDNELLAQSMTQCFEIALSKFLNDNKKE